MKLRNKNTGGVFDVRIAKHSITDNIILSAIDSKEESGFIFKGEYDTLAELNADWEDYTPSEPLIKDPKIRKAVRAWAELNKIDKVKHLHSEGMSGFCYNDIDGNDFLLDFIFTISELDAGGTYTITELCGEERE